jgi:hypothetical protein
MAATVTAASATPAGAAPAGLNEAQLLVFKRLEAHRAAIADLTPLDPDFPHMERLAEQHARLTGEDQ